MAGFSENPASYGGTTFDPPAALDIITLQNAIVALLQTAAAQAGSAMATLAIEAFPDNPSESYQLRNAGGAILVGYAGSRYSPLEPAAGTIQTRTLTWEITIASRSLARSAVTGLGAFTLIEAVRMALAGQRLTGALTPLFPTHDQFVARDPKGAVWYAAIYFEMRTTAVANQTVETLANFIQGNFNLKVNGAASSDETEAAAAGGTAPKNPSN